jgi:hypothetical protein
LPRSGLKPLFPPETHGVSPLADAARRLNVSCGKRAAALPACTRGLAAAYTKDVRPTRNTTPTRPYLVAEGRNLVTPTARAFLFVIGITLAAGGGVVAYATRQTLFTFETTPLQLPVVIGTSWTTAAPFTTGSAGEYEIQFVCQNPRDLRQVDFGRWDRLLESARIRWQVLTVNRVVAHGSSETYPENSYGRGGGTDPPRSGYEIGRFTARKGVPYILHVTVEAGDDELNKHKPRVNVELNGQELSDMSNIDEAREFLQVQSKRAVLIGIGVAGLGILGHVLRRPSAA